MRVLRIYHGGRLPAHRARERALVHAGVEVSLVVPSGWPDRAGGALLEETIPTFELPVTREGDVNRHSYRSREVLRDLLASLRPDVLDIHEEPFSVAARQWLAATPADLPVVMYTAQNVAKRFPPPFTQYERTAYRRISALYPCSAQAASVARGKGFSGPINVLPLGYDDSVFGPGVQSLDDEELTLALAGRLVPEKGVTDAVRILARTHAVRPTRLVIIGAGPEEARARELARALGVPDRIEFQGWKTTAELASSFGAAHIVLVPSWPTETWVEQFGRVIVEAQASGAVVAGYASGSIPEVAGEAAVLAETGNVTQLAGRIVELLGDPRDYALRREEGFALSRSRTWACIAEQHAELYRMVGAGDVQLLRLPGSPRKRRALAREEFGHTAATVAGGRPFALPVLRRGGAAAAVLARVLDAIAETTARMRELRAEAR